MTSLKARTSRLRGRVRRRVLAVYIPGKVAEYPLEIGMSVWGVQSGVNVATGHVASHSLSVLPGSLSITWAVLMLLAALTVMTGVFWRPVNATIARGMYLFAFTLVSYSAAIIGASGWHRGGITALFFFIIGLVVFLRGYWLKEREAALERELARSTGVS